jgi:beta-galactosidase beta subunit
MDRSSKPLQRPGARGFSETAESPTKSLLKPFNIHMHHSDLHVYIEGREAIPSGAASGLQKTSGSGQAAPSLDFGVR